MLNIKSSSAVTEFYKGKCLQIADLNDGSWVGNLGAFLP